MLEFMRLDPVPENISILTNLGNAQALYQDMYGRTGILTFDAVFADLIEAFKTTPTDAAAAAQEKARQEGGKKRA